MTPEVAKRIHILHAAKAQDGPEIISKYWPARCSTSSLLLRHYNRGSGEGNEREVSPATPRLPRQLVSRCLVPICARIRSFAVNAIRHASIGETPAQSVSDDDLNAVLAAGYGILVAARCNGPVWVYACRWVTAGLASGAENPLRCRWRLPDGNSLAPNRSC